MNTNINTTKYVQFELVFDFPVGDITDLNDYINSITANEKRNNLVLTITNARKIWKTRFDSKHNDVEDAW